MSESKLQMSGTRIRRRTIVGAIVVAAIAMLAAQVLLRGLFLDLEIIDGRIISVVFHMIVVAVPVVFFLAWRITVEQKVRVEEMLRASEGLREDLTSMLIHDLKSPMISAGLALGALSSREEIQSRIEDDERELLAIARESLTRLEKMIGDMLDIAKAEAGAMPIDLEHVDLGELVRRSVRHCGPQLSDARIEMRLEIGEGALRARVDPGKIRRVLDNLLTNAIKFTPAGGSIEVRAVGGGGECVITVQDSGRGIPDSLQGRIFEKFGQVEARRQGRKMSVGLGLYFCKLVVDAHGGRIWVESAEGRGSLFGIALPLAESAGAEAPVIG
jgi:two-component system sensor histidine kinase/response regulator